MEDEEYNTTIKRYDNRMKEWYKISVTQISNTNTIIFTLASGLLIFCIDKKPNEKIYFELLTPLNWKIVFYLTSISLLSISIIFGVGVLFARLYDFKITRQIVLTRKRVYEKYKKKLPNNDFDDEECTDRIKALFTLIFSKFKFIPKNKISNDLEGVKAEFEGLRRLSQIMGSATWIWIKWQIIAFILGGFIFLINKIF